MFVFCTPSKSKLLLNISVGLLSVNKILLMSNDDYFELGCFSVDDINTLKDTAAKSIFSSGFRRGI